VVVGGQGRAKGEMLRAERGGDDITRVLGGEVGLQVVGEKSFLNLAGVQDLYTRKELTFTDIK